MFRRKRYLNKPLPGWLNGILVVGSVATLDGVLPDTEEACAALLAAFSFEGGASTGSSRGGREGV